MMPASRTVSPCRLSVPFALLPSDHQAGMAKSQRAAHSHTGTKSAEAKLPQSCCTASIAFSSAGYVTSTASSALMGCTGPANVPMASRAVRTRRRGACPKPSSSSAASVAARQASVTALYSLFWSTRPPSITPPITINSSKPAPAMSIVAWSSMPARTSFCSAKAPTTLVTAIEVTKAARGATKPGVWNISQACAGNTNSSPFVDTVSWTDSFCNAEADGGVGGLSWKKTRAPTATKTAATVVRPKYSFNPPSVRPSSPPRRKAVAMPT
mmetsp:Transcript_15923/g.43681  ORF Transcript_15923/g.43681 Transcript_15923/m.43681 type:complete len:269 (-) Transcript_15923:1217-2023(-)